MRCNNCGWDNLVNNAKCEKCGAPFVSTPESDDFSSSEKLSSKRFDPGKTAQGCPECGYPIRIGEKSCPNCGYSFEKDKPVLAKYEPIAVISSKRNPIPTPVTAEPVGKTCATCHTIIPPSSRFCPNCGISLTQEKHSLEGTVTPWKQTAQSVKTAECSLTLIAMEGEELDKTPLHFSGDVIQLNRGNTEPNNPTITSKVQAELSFENDKWYIQDKSDLKTTYLHAGDRMELQQEDIILLGNRSFQFNY